MLKRINKIVRKLHSEQVYEPVDTLFVLHDKIRNRYTFLGGGWGATIARDSQDHQWVERLLGDGNGLPDPKKAQTPLYQWKGPGWETAGIVRQNDSNTGECIVCVSVNRLSTRVCYLFLMHTGITIVMMITIVIRKMLTSVLPSCFRVILKQWPWWPTGAQWGCWWTCWR